MRVDTTLVSLPVSVMDRDGKYIPNLGKEDFRVWEDGVEQRVAYFASTEKPFTVALVIDTSASTRYKVNEIQDAAIAFVNQLRPDDRVMVVSFDDKIRVLAQPTSDRSALRNAILQTKIGSGTRLYDAMDQVINQYFNHIEGRKAIVLFTDGVDTTSKHASYESTVRDAEELDALIYPVEYDTSSDMAGWPGGAVRVAAAAAAAVAAVAVAASLSISLARFSEVEATMVAEAVIPGVAADDAVVVAVQVIAGASMSAPINIYTTWRA